ncbi:hypothetical protein [Streptomyces sp. NPDC001980]|uniref:hypothetical protein n=1 Tax=Streptomyces sp. NPDC001980 TaxID=3157126 RepID=UPI003331C287
MPTAGGLPRVAGGRGPFQAVAGEAGGGAAFVRQQADAAARHSLKKPESELEV